jgi:K+-sensing histidine kinase KdpD
MLGFVTGLVFGMLIGAGGLFLVFLFGIALAERDSRLTQGFPRNNFLLWLLPILFVSVLSYSLKLVDPAVVLLLLLAVITIARLGGYGKGLLATGLCAATLAVVILPDQGTFWVYQRNDQLVVVLFLVCASLGSLLAGHIRRFA